MRYMNQYTRVEPGSLHILYCDCIYRTIKI